MKDYEALSKRHFNGQAGEYDMRDTALYSKYPKISCKDAAERLKSVPYERLLDVGCGTGYLIELLQKQRAAAYYGLDLSPEMLKRAAAKLGDAVALTEGAAGALPYEDETFDVVTCIQSFHHYPYPEKAMAEVHRVLKPNGLYLLSDTGMGGLPQWFYNHWLLKRVDTGDYAVYSRQNIADRMTAGGFQIVQAYNLRSMIYTVIGKKG